MKNLFLLMVAFLLFCCTSPELIEENIDRNESILENNPVLNLSEEEASKTLVSLVRLIERANNRYVFDISREKALRLGATPQEYNDVVEAVNFMNAYMEKVESERETIVMENDLPSPSLSRAYLSAVTDRILFADHKLLPLVNTPANFSGPSTIVVSGGASSLLWTLVFRENNKGIEFSFSSSSPDNLIGREVRSPLADPNNPTVWNWIISNASGNAAFAWCEFKTSPYDPLNTGTSAPFTHPFPPDFHVSASDNGGWMYDVVFNNRTLRSYSYRIRTIGEQDKKGTFLAGASISMAFQKGKEYELEMTNERWGEWYNLDWIVPL